jgi:poly-gamma-glutamate synthesis protein (capsule biosynthesis protein)
LKNVYSLVFYLLGIFSAFTANGQDDQKRSIRLIFAGDVMGHSGQIESAEIKSGELYDYTPCFQFVKPLVTDADLAIANLELTLPGKPPFTGYPQFKSPNELALALKDAGFDLLVTANNHSNDSYASGLINTLDVLDSYHFLHTGTFRNTDERLMYYPLLVYKNDFRIAFLNYTYGTNGIPTREPTLVNLIDVDQMEKDLAEAKALKPDAIIVVMHWGLEYQLQESSEQDFLAQKLFDAGADFIIGAHPHVVQPIKEVELEREGQKRTGLVVYSLGNYISGQTKTNTDGGIMVELTLEKDLSSKETILKEHSFIPVWRYIRTLENGKKEFLILTEKELDHPGLLNSDARLKMESYFKRLRNHLANSDGNEKPIATESVDVK